MQQKPVKTANVTSATATTVADAIDATDVTAAVVSADDQPLSMNLEVSNATTVVTATAQQQRGEDSRIGSATFTISERKKRNLG